MKNRDEMIDLIEQKFPKVWTKPSEEFDGRKDAIWTGEGSEIEIHSEEIGVFSIETFDYWNESTLYEMGVHKDFAKFLEKHGWWAECHDPGTYFLYQQ